MQLTDKAFGIGSGAVFAVETDREHLVVVQEVRPSAVTTDLRTLATGVQALIGREFNIPAGNVLLVRPGTIRKTTSGKIQRTLMRQLFLKGGITPCTRCWSPPCAPSSPTRSTVPRMRWSDMEHPPYRLAGELDAFLGDPADPSETFSYARCVELDEKEEFPAAICHRLEEWGLADHYVPVRAGGRLRDYEQLLQLIRTVARRDLTVAIGHGKTYLGGVCVWIAGSDEQAARLGADIRAGVPVSLGLTERAHGSDLLAGEVQGAGTDDEGGSSAARSG
ncbi:hypothetical protein GCM10020256_50320 [Streptomyces thermocoprophilus]